METCIQRYRARRKLDEVRSNILTKYFMLGGVDSTSKAFTGGLDKETVENSTAAEIAAIQASDFLQTGSKNAKYYDGSDGWVVDFESVVKGYLYDPSSSLMEFFSLYSAPTEFPACSHLIARTRSRQS